MAPAVAQKVLLGNIDPSQPGFMLFCCLGTDGKVRLTRLRSLRALYSMCHKSEAYFDAPVLFFILAAAVKPSPFVTTTR